MSSFGFKGFGKIPRGNPLLVTITEKINGTNACVVCGNNGVVLVQSRKRIITTEDDNFGFAAWVEENKEDLAGLGAGYSYGEWAGPGIQKNPHNLDEKTFFLFNVSRWADEQPDFLPNLSKWPDARPACCSVVPVLFQGELTPGQIDDILHELKQNAGDGVTPEGIIIYHHLTRSYTKHTIISPDGKWKEAKC